MSQGADTPTARRTGGARRPGPCYNEPSPTGGPGFISRLGPPPWRMARRKPKARAEPDNSLGVLSRDVRESLADTTTELDWQVKQIQAVLRHQLVLPTVDFRMIQSMEISQGILVDKQQAVLRQLRDLEQAVDEELEAAFVIYEVGPRGGRRRVGGGRR